MYEGKLHPSNYCRRNVSTKVWRPGPKLYTQTWNCWGLRTHKQHSSRIPACQRSLDNLHSLQQGKWLPLLRILPNLLDDYVEVCNMHEAAASLVLSLGKRKAEQESLGARTPGLNSPENVSPQVSIAYGIRAWRSRSESSDCFSLQKPEALITRKEPCLLALSYPRPSSCPWAAPALVLPPCLRANQPPVHTTLFRAANWATGSTGLLPSSSCPLVTSAESH